MNSSLSTENFVRSLARWSLAASLIISSAASISLAGPLDEPVLELFETKCSECHEKDMDEPELGKAMNLRDLRQSKFMKPGHPEKSDIYRLVSLPADNKERMPRSRGPQGGEKYKAPLTDAEKSLLRDWIADGGVPAARTPSAAAGQESDSASGSPRPFISEDEIHALVLKDLKSGGLQDQRSWRYVTLHNYYNQPDIPDSLLDEYVQAVSMLANSLSNRPKIVRPKSLDSRNVVFRIDARDYGFGSSLWESLMRHYPFGLNRGTEVEAEIEILAGNKPVNQQRLPELRKSENTSETLDADGKEWPIARADWWVFMLSQPPLYYEVLGLPGSSAIASKRGTDKERLGIDGELERDILKVTINKETIASGQVLRMGFEKSKVSQGHRVVERHSVGTDGGYYWKSFDFNKDRTQVNTLLNPADIFRAPLGPPEYGLTIDPRLRFRHDGGEMIFSLPNGLQGYLLTDGQGKRLDRGPFEVVQDEKHPRRSIIAGVSCMGCHPQGINSPLNNIVDQIARLADDMPLRDHERETLKTLYGRQKEINDLMAADMTRFAKALKDCGVTAERNPVWTLYEQFLFKAINVEHLGAEFGTDKPGIADKLMSSNIAEVRSSASRPTMDRLVFLSIFSAAAEELGLGTARPFTPIAVAETEAAFKDVGAATGLLTNPLKGASRSGWTPPAAGLNQLKGSPARTAPKMRRVDDPND